ncbi:hypothetical protein CTAYLR_010660 [Chrysophaeum taylorii]|uniref:Glycosyl transferase family 25 domain-containing protein n=1 Tax=Chrysophaeum taylorii TaxID=2483200 RepID=A0AAD7U5X5_9STRA|nr:hypothetical protein CTAYLR_010660 [Chrysophaeum taylorii]
MGLVAALVSAAQVVPHYYVSTDWDPVRAVHISAHVAKLSAAAHQTAARCQGKNNCWNKVIESRKIRATDVETAASVLRARNLGGHGWRRVHSQLVTPFPNMLGRRSSPQNATLEDAKEGLNLTLAEVACTLSHVETIRSSYDAGDEVALVTEDDVTFERFDFELFNVFVEAMLHSRGMGVVVQLYTMGSSWTRRGLLALEPRHLVRGYGYGTMAYVLNRACMRRILETFDYSPTNFTEADSLVYLTCKPYMTSRPLVTHDGANSTIHGPTQVKHHTMADKAEHEFEAAIALDRGLALIKKRDLCAVGARRFADYETARRRDTFQRKVYCLLAASLASNNETATATGGGASRSPRSLQDASFSCGGDHPVLMQRRQALTGQFLAPCPATHARQNASSFQQPPLGRRR